MSDDDEDDEELRDVGEGSPELLPKDSRNQDSDGGNISLKIFHVFFIAESRRSASHNSLMDEEAEDKASEIDDDEEDGDGGEEEENEDEVDSEDELAMHKLLSTSQKMGNAGLFDKNR